MGEAGLEDFGDEVFEQHTAQGGPGLKFAKQRIGQIEDGSHKNIFTRQCMRGGGQGLGAPTSSSAFNPMPAGTPALPGVALPGVARPEALDQGHASGVAHKRALTGFW